MEEIEKQRIVEDYYTVNALAGLNIDSVMYTVPNSCFDVDADAIVEFYLAATTDYVDRLNPDPLNDVLEINLITGITTIA